jgi:hypothetical protein
MNFLLFVVSEIYSETPGTTAVFTVGVHSMLSNPVRNTLNIELVSCLIFAKLINTPKCR